MVIYEEGLAYSRTPRPQKANEFAEKQQFLACL